MKKRVNPTTKPNRLKRKSLVTSATILLTLMKMQSFWRIKRSRTKYRDSLTDLMLKSLRGFWCVRKRSNLQLLSTNKIHLLMNLQPLKLLKDEDYRSAYSGCRILF